MESRPFSACKHTVSGSLSLPSRGSFHRSLTVLFAIGHLVVFSLTRWSSHIHTGFLVSCATPEFDLPDFDFGYGAITLYCASFQKSSPTNLSTLCRSKTPKVFPPLVWAILQFRSPLLPQSFVYSLFLCLLSCFSSAGSPHNMNT